MTTALGRTAKSLARGVGGFRTEMAGRHTGRVGIVAAVVGIAADIGTRWQNFLGWIVVITLTLALSCFVLRFLLRNRARSIEEQGHAHRLVRSLSIYATITTAIFSPFYALNQILGDDKGIVGTYVPVIAEFQDLLDERLRPIEDKLDRIEHKMAFAEALKLLEQATAARNGSNQGQSEAMMVLLAAEFDFKRMDFSGVSIKNANLAKADFTDALFHFSDLHGSSFQHAVLAGADLRLARADERTDFSHAKLTGVIAPLVEATGTKFIGADLSGSNFYGAKLRGADLNGADLSGAAFAYADLRDADLRGANLSGTHLVGALLVGAKLDGTTFHQTNMLGAIVAPSLLTPQQSAGTCRHAARADRGVVNMIEHSDGVYTEISRSERFFPVGHVRSRKLPPCNSNPKSAIHFNGNHPFETHFHLQHSYLSKPGRRTQAIERVVALRERLTEAQAEGPVFDGAGEYQEAWTQAMRRAATVSTPAGPPYADSDFLLTLLIAEGIVASDEVDWPFSLQMRLELERGIQSIAPDRLERHTHWPAFFPALADRDDLPEESLVLFRDWTLLRARGEMRQIQLRPPSVLRTRENGERVLSFETGLLRETPEGLNFKALNLPTSHSAQEIAEVAGGSDRLIMSPAALHRHGIGRLVFAFPEPYRRYEIAIPDTLPLSVESNPDIDLVLRIDRIQRTDSKPALVIVFVTPLEARLNISDASPTMLEIRRAAE